MTYRASSEGRASFEAITFLGGAPLLLKNDLEGCAPSNREALSSKVLQKVKGRKACFNHNLPLPMTTPLPVGTPKNSVLERFAPIMKYSGYLVSSTSDL